MKQRTGENRSALKRTLIRFLCFFALISFIVASNVLLFVYQMQLDHNALWASAPRTLFNVVVLSAAGSLVYGLWQHFAVDRVAHNILQMTDRIAAGDFTARLVGRDMAGGMREFRSIGENLNTMAAELSGTETLRTDFIANVSHELKTPLAIIQNYAVLLQQPTLTEVHRAEYAKAICDGTRRLVSLITNILKLNKLENQKIYPQAQSYNLGEQLRECLLGFEDAWEKKNLDIDAEQIDDVKVQADPDLLTLVWNNLLSNAIKFTPEGGKITVSLYQTGNTAMVRVTDTGCGMSADTGKHIFEKFYQGDTSHATQGNGLGLSLVKRVVGITGGSVSVESTPGRGSTFTVELPCNTPPHKSTIKLQSQGA